MIIRIEHETSELRAMDWLTKNYERVALIVAIAILFFGGAALFRSAVSFNQFAELQNAPVQRPASPPGKANEVRDADQRSQSASAMDL